MQRSPLAKLAEGSAIACGKEFDVVVELDGTTHSDAAYDQHRTLFLETQGLLVLRIGNLDVYENMVGVLEAILAAVTERTKRPHQSLRASFSRGEAKKIIRFSSGEAGTRNS